MLQELKSPIVPQIFMSGMGFPPLPCVDLKFTSWTVKAKRRPWHDNLIPMYILMIQQCSIK